MHGMNKILKDGELNCLKSKDDERFTEDGRNENMQRNKDSSPMVKITCGQAYPLNY